MLVFCFFLCNVRLCFVFFFSSRRRHTRCSRDWSSDVCSSDLVGDGTPGGNTLGTKTVGAGVLLSLTVMPQPARNVAASARHAKRCSITINAASGSLVWRQGPDVVYQVPALLLGEH